PGKRVISEEKDGDLENSKEEYLDSFIIDPLDGTRNFAMGNPNFVVSIGHVLQNGEFEGVVYYPVLKELFTAVDGKSFLNGKLIKVSMKSQLSDALVGFWDKREKDPSWSGIDISDKLRGKVKMLRIFGVCAL